MISLARGVPSTDLLPARRLADAARQALQADPFGALSYGEAEGYPPLRSWFARELGVDAGRILLTNGSLQGLALLAAHLSETGRHVIVEAPTYDFALRIMRRAGVPVSAVALDGDGLDVGALERLLERHGDSALYTIPTFHNPTGTTMSAEKRRAVLELARERDLLILEDDPYRRLTIDGEPPPTLLSADDGQRVIHLTSLTKTVAPGLRCGAIVLPAELVDPIVDAARETYIAPGRFAQVTAMAYIDSGWFEPGVEAVRAALRERRDAAMESLAGASGVSWVVPNGGYFLWLELRGRGAVELSASAVQAGVEVVPGHDFFVDRRPDRHLRVAFCAAPVEELRDGMARLVHTLGSTSKTEHERPGGEAGGPIHTLGP